LQLTPKNIIRIIIQAYIVKSPKNPSPLFCQMCIKPSPETHQLISFHKVFDSALLHLANVKKLRYCSARIGPGSQGSFQNLTMSPLLSFTFLPAKYTSLTCNKDFQQGESENRGSILAIVLFLR
jgi:hypothetical protein